MDLVQLIMINASLLAVSKRVLYLDWRIEAVCSPNTDKASYAQLQQSN